MAVRRRSIAETATVGARKRALIMIHVAGALMVSFVTSKHDCLLANAYTLDAAAISNASVEAGKSTVTGYDISAL